ncbi:MAG TPA: pitrilysin family protein [Longimicrobiales bacterium]|nr:pitrilysin family protein [Longimicrobiales bacterium]
MTRRLLTVLLLAGTGACRSGAARPVESPTPRHPDVGREAAAGLTFPPLEFDPPAPVMHTLAGGVRVLHVQDPTLPLVNVLARFRGGYALFPREYYGAASAVPALLRNGGTTRLSPDSVDALFELYALQTTFGSGGESAFAAVNVLARDLARGVELWGELLRDPGFDPAQVEVWRGRELENARRRTDDPGRLAFSEFNRLMYGSHPVGWELRPGDLEPEDLSRDRLEWVHRRVFCPENLVLGVTGDVAWTEVEPLLTDMLEGWRPCSEPLPERPLPDIRKGGGVFLIPRKLSQSTIVLAEASDVVQGDDAPYFASRIGNAILGAGGFSSRIMTRVRTEEGYAYSASSLWTAPRRGQGLVGAVTRTRGATTVAAVKLILDILRQMREEPPTIEEVRTAVEEYTNGFVFNFESAARIVSRQMVYRSEGLPEDWLERYLEGIQDVTPGDVQQAFRRYVRPDEMVILVLGDPSSFDEPLEELGPVTVLDVDDPGRSEEGSSPDRQPAGEAGRVMGAYGPSGGRRSRR